MDHESYPVEWHRRGKDGADLEVTLQLGKLSAGVKRAYANWLKPLMLADAREWMGVEEYLSFRESLIEPGKEKTFWSAAPCLAVARSLDTKEGLLKLTRLQCADVKGWPDDELWAMLEAKNRDKDSDYRLAFDLLWDEAHPKAATGTAPTPPSNGGADPAGSTGSLPN